MTNTLEMSGDRSCPAPRARRLRWVGAALLTCLTLCGCQAVTNPLLDGIPARRLPPEYLGRSRESLANIPLSLLRRKPPEQYLVDSGDILGVYIQGILPKEGPPQINTTTGPDTLPSTGVPVLVQLDGKIVLPNVQPIPVKDKTLDQIQNIVLETYLKAGILRQEKDARPVVLVTLFKRRTYHVLVVRQDAMGNQPNQTGGAFGIGTVGQATGVSGRGTGVALDLPAYENDVMNALTRSGGLPGFDAADEVLVERGYFDPKAGVEDPETQVQEDTRAASLDPAEFGGRVKRIPLRLPAGQRPDFTEKDIVLNNGDIIYVATRASEVFYVGGLLFTGQYQLPRDYDLGVVEAIAVTRGTLVNGGVSSFNNFTGGTGVTGIGTPNPSAVSIIRRLPHGQQVNIYVDLNRAMRDPRENILIQPKDIIVLQFTPGEAIAKYFTTVFQYNFFGTIIRQQDLTATTTLTGP